MEKNRKRQTYFILEVKSPDEEFKQGCAGLFCAVSGETLAQDILNRKINY